MQTCPKCKSKSVHFCDEVLRDGLDAIYGYLSCISCGWKLYGECVSPREVARLNAIERRDIKAADKIIK